YQRQDFDTDGVGVVDGGVYGGRISWFPTRDLTFTATLDKALGVSSPGNDPLALPSVTDTTAASLEAQWQATRQISASARFGYQFVDYEMQDREDDVWRA